MKDKQVYGEQLCHLTLGKPGTCALFEKKLFQSLKTFLFLIPIEALMMESDQLALGNTAAKLHDIALHDLKGNWKISPCWKMFD